MGIPFIVLIILFIVMIFCYINLKKEYHLQLDSNLTLRRTINFLQRDDIQELLSHVEAVMAGDVVYEWNREIEERPSPLIAYSINRDTFPTTHTIEFSLSVLKIDLDENRGEIIVSYSLMYYDSEGKILSARSIDPDRPTKWTIERQENAWVIVEISNRFMH